MELHKNLKISGGWDQDHLFIQNIVALVNIFQILLEVSWTQKIVADLLFPRKMANWLHLQHGLQTHDG